MEKPIEEYKKTLAECQEVYGAAKSGSENPHPGRQEMFEYIKDRNKAGLSIWETPSDRPLGSGGLMDAKIVIASARDAHGTGVSILVPQVMAPFFVVMSGRGIQDNYPVTSRNAIPELPSPDLTWKIDLTPYSDWTIDHDPESWVTWMDAEPSEMGWWDTDFEGYGSLIRSPFEIEVTPEWVLENGQRIGYTAGDIIKGRTRPGEAKWQKYWLHDRVMPVMRKYKWVVASGPYPGKAGGMNTPISEEGSVTVSTIKDLLTFTGSGRFIKRYHP
jgi:hypothetical protein